MEVNGSWPALQGQELEALVAEEYWYNGDLDESANILWLLVDGHWLRVFFDLGVIYFRVSPTPPSAYTMDELGAEVRLVDAGVQLGLVSQRIMSVDTRPIASGAEVVLMFEGGNELRYRSINDSYSFDVHHA